MARQYSLSLLAVLVLNLSCFNAEKVTLCALNSTDFEANETLCDVHCKTIKLKDVTALSDRYPKVEVHLCSAEYNSSDVPVAMFTSSLSVTITGSGNGSRLNCQRKESGLHFNNISRIDIQNVTLYQCGFEVNAVELKYKGSVTVGVYIVNSTNISLSNVLIKSSPGIGLLLMNNKGYIIIINSRLDQNYAPNSTKPGGGIFINSTSNQHSEYCIKNCNFTGNKANRNSSYFDKKNNIFISGGGLRALFGGESCNTSMAIVSCRFTNNTARQGGALDLSFKGSAHNVEVMVEGSEFKNNVAIKSGGAVFAGYIADTSKMAQNHIEFSSCNFTGNEAENGGGTFVYSTPDYFDHTESKNNSFTFFNCIWTRNNGFYGSAIMISPHISKEFLKDGKLPIPLFHNCLFAKNIHKNRKQRHHNLYDISLYSNGIMYVNTFAISLKGEVNFTENSNTAVYLFSSRFVIASNSSILFDRNFGYQGGAIHMEVSASIDFNDNSSIAFVNNTAVDRGGAIYHTAPTDHGLLMDKNCFLKYVGVEEDIGKRKITMMFDNNTLVSNGPFAINFTRQSIFLFSVVPCCNVYGKNTLEIHKALNEIGNFSFAQHDDTIETFASNFSVRDLPKTLIPGIENELSISLIDYTNRTVIPPAYEVRIKQYNSSIAVDPAYTIVTNNKIKLNGQPGHRGEIQLVLLSMPSMSLSFNVTLRHCPPGYVFENSTMVCICSANTVDRLYLGIHRCNHTINQANLVNGYWAGYTADAKTINFRISACPIRYCSNKLTEVLLPYEERNLNDLICSKNRSGVVCAECKNGTSVFYHTFECSESKYCSLGGLFYVLSQLLPVTIFFLIVILFDIQLTTGALNGLLFYVQIFSTLAVNANNFITFPNGTNILLSALEFIVSIFNLNFFNISQLSFCLHKKAISLDVIIFDYIIVVYSLLLIIFTVLIMNLRCYRVKCFQKLYRRKILFSQSIIHGLSGFLVMCYARTTTTTLRLLTPVWLHVIGPHKNEARVFYYGTMTYFKGAHLKYALPALFALIFVTLLPPLLLLVYPLCYKVLAFLRLEESKFAKVLCKVIPLEKFKPFFDSFQGAFKDNHRYFAGLYFVYRLSALVTFAFVSNLVDFYFHLEIQLIFMLALHAWVQPYKNNRHNRLDLCIFTLLLILNGITFYNHQWTLSQFNKTQTIQAFGTIQVLLAYAPIIFMIACILSRIRVKYFVKRLREKFQNKKKDDDLTVSLSMFDDRRVEDSETNYQNF